MENENINQEDNELSQSLTIASSHSTQISLEAVRKGKAGLDSHKQRMLDSVPKTGDWAKFNRDSLDIKDLAYLTAKIGDEFAILRGKKEDILFHGDRTSCSFTGELKERLDSHQLELYAHAHPGEPRPIPSIDDRRVLARIKQPRSLLISAMTGRIVEYGPDEFEPL